MKTEHGTSPGIQINRSLHPVPPTNLSGFMPTTRIGPSHISVLYQLAIQRPSVRLGGRLVAKRWLRLVLIQILGYGSKTNKMKRGMEQESGNVWLCWKVTRMSVNVWHTQVREISSQVAAGIKRYGFGKVMFSSTRYDRFKICWTDSSTSWCWLWMSGRHDGSHTRCQISSVASYSRGSPFTVSS